MTTTSRTESIVPPVSRRTLLTGTAAGVAAFAAGAIGVPAILRAQDVIKIGWP